MIEAINVMGVAKTTRNECAKSGDNNLATVGVTREDEVGRVGRQCVCDVGFMDYCDSRAIALQKLLQSRIKSGTIPSQTDKC